MGRIRRGSTGCRTGWAEALLERLSAPLTPLTLFSVGFQLQFRGIRSRLRGLALGLGYKLALAPALVMAGLWVMPGMAPVVREAVLLQNAMAPMASASSLVVS